MAGRIGGTTISNYYIQRPWLALIIASLSAISIIGGFVLKGMYGVLFGAVVTVILALFPPAVTKIRETHSW